LPGSGGRAKLFLMGGTVQTLDSVEALEALYGVPLETATIKEVSYVTPEYAQFIAASPFVSFATSGPEGLDCSPRGDLPGFVRVADPKTLLMPDRRGNNRIDSLRNVVRDPRVALLFLVPGVGNTLRVNGLGRVSIEPALLESFAVDGRAPRSVVVVQVTAAYFQCARALVRSDLWNPAKHIDPNTLPSAGQMLASLSDARVGGEAYDRQWAERAKATLW
jgi:PPOX class probable FMN-dependent enzyme